MQDMGVMSAIVSENVSKTMEPHSVTYQSQALDSTVTAVGICQ